MELVGRDLGAGHCLADGEEEGEVGLHVLLGVAELGDLCREVRWRSARASS